VNRLDQLHDAGVSIWLDAPVLQLALDDVRRAADLLRPTTRSAPGAAAAGAQPQRPLWASTGTKDPAYSDVLYVEQLIAPGVINTMPWATPHAFADHGDATHSFESNRGAVRPWRPSPHRTHWDRPRRHHRGPLARARAQVRTPTTRCSAASRPSAPRNSSGRVPGMTCGRNAHARTTGSPPSTGSMTAVSRLRRAGSASRLPWMIALGIDAM
jgi:hypothetical protein